MIYIESDFIEADHNYWIIEGSELGISKYGKKDFRLGLRLTPTEDKELGQFKKLKHAKKAYLTILRLTLSEFKIAKYNQQ